LRAQRLLLKIYINGKRSPEIEDTVDQIIADFPGDANLPKELHEIAKECEWAPWGDYEDAKYVYQKIAQYYPDTSYGSRAQMEIPKMVLLRLIADHRYDEAATAYNQLKADFSEHTDFPATLYDIARRYEWRLQHDTAVAVNQELINDYPDCWWVENARLAVMRNTIMGLIASDRDSEIPAAIEELGEQFAGHMDFPMVLYSIAERYELAGKKEAAEGLYLQVINQYPENLYADRSRLKVFETDVSNLIEPGDFNEVQTTIDNLIDNYNDNKGLPQVIFYVGHHYYNKARIKKQESLEDEARDELIKAITIWERLIQEIPQSEYTPRAYFTSAVCYSQELRDYEMGIEYFERIVDNWPVYEYAWSAQYQTGRYYEKLRDSGAIGVAEANEKIEQAYMAVLENYPDCSLAPDACLKMAAFSLKRQQRLEAITFFELFLELAKPNDPRIERIKAKLEGLGNAVE